MRGNAQSIQSRRKGRSKAKACGTCKSRKIKCDETFPACRRCFSTGRVCDGYGVWGGGGTSQGSSNVIRNSCVTASPLASVSLLTTSTEDKYYYEWFKLQTSRKCPGLFVLTFWDTLIFQASLNEPAVLHALLTMSCIHKNINHQKGNNDTPDDKEQLMLSNYSKAIGHLKPHFSTKARTSTRVALIACVVFVCVEYFRGHFREAQAHLQNGLKVLRESQAPATLAADGTIVLNPSRELVDDWLLEEFSRLQIQVALFTQTYQQPVLDLKTSRSGLLPPRFQCLNEAWVQLERLFYDILYLTKQSRERLSDAFSLQASTLLLEHQQSLKLELAGWLDLYELSRKEVQNALPREYQIYGEFAYHLLLTYNVVAKIMLDTCLYPDDESIFDSQTDQFVTVIREMAYTYKLMVVDTGVPQKEGEREDLAGSLVDIGWILPLYYTALNCRVHRLRLQAIRLLETSNHREGLWDARIAARIGRKVMEIEERDFYKEFDVADDFVCWSAPRESDLALPILPAAYRIRDVTVDLPDGPTDSFFLSYKQKQSNGEWTEILQEYNQLRKCWKEVESKENWKKE